ncbi:MAG: glycosyltransferase family 2 protein, partial [Actinomycetota bacterium]|nr:glycosyltransferase family 2 protein [Actinomycetota bacterium]
MSAPSIDIIIVNWNTGDYLRDCLRSILAARSPACTVERVTVVDNASCDASMTSLEALDLPLELIHNRGNVGFAAACNQGAAGSRSEFLLFLNPDARLFPDTLRTVTTFMANGTVTPIGICGAQMVDDQGRPVMSCARFPTLRVLFGKMTGLDRILPTLFPPHHLTTAETTESRLVDQVIGAFFFVRRELFVRLGGFDERYFLYFEEVDFARRARTVGARSYFLKPATVFHAGNVSSAQDRRAQLYQSLRSRMLYAFDHWPRGQATALLVLSFTVELGARLTNAAVHGDGRAATDVAASY